MNNRITQVFALTLISLVLAGCSAVGPDYQRPDAPSSEQFKEAKGWKKATPSDLQPKGAWWDLYQDDTLSALIAQVRISNQNVAEYAADYEKAKAVAEEAGANLYPSIGATASATRSGSQSQTSNA
ncbi:hypothetical protein [Marinomonas sp.]